MKNFFMKDLFTDKHEGLIRIAKIANVLAILVFVVNTISIFAWFFDIQLQYINQCTFNGQPPDFWRMLGRNPLYVSSLAVTAIKIFIEGVVYWLVLKGIALGLNMIVETNLNYKKAFQGETNE